MSRWVPVAIVAACALLPRVAHAQVPAAPDTVTVSPVVVTATRLAVPAAAVSAAVTVLRGDSLRALGLHFVADALRDVPGLTVVRAGSYGAQTSLFVRGGESDYVKVLLDGVPANEPGGAFDFAHLTTDAIERIEIVRGPGSVLYGSDAVAGVIQIFTRAGRTGADRARLAGSLTAGGGSYGTMQLGADLSGQSGAVAWGVGASREGSDGVYGFNNDYRNTSVAGRARVELGARTAIGVTARYRDATSHFPTDGGGVPNDSNQLVRDRGPTLGLEWSQQLSARLEAVVTGALHATDARSDDAPDSPGDTLGFYASNGVNKTRRAGLGAQVNWLAGNSGTLTAGVDVESQRLEYSSLSQSQFGPFADSGLATRDNQAVYAQLVTPTERELALTLGARLENNDGFGTYLTWRAGGALRASPQTRVRVTVGTGFKEPTFTEQFGGFGTIGNRDLDPERSRSWEAGIEHRLGDRVTLSATYFDQLFSDLIAFTFAPPPPDTVNYFNIAGATARGAELGFSAVLPWGLRAEGHYTWLRTEVTDSAFAPGSATAFAAGAELLRRPDEQAGLSLGWQPPQGGRVSAGIEGIWVGDREDLDFSSFPSSRVVLPAYTVVNLTAAVDLSGPGRPGLVLRARVDNLFDAVYEEVVHFRTPRRSLFLGGEVRLPD